MKLLCATRRPFSLLMLSFVTLSALSACSPNHTEVGNWWYDQQWEAASVAGETDQ